MISKTTEETTSYTAEETEIITAAFIILPEAISIKDLQGLLDGYSAARGLSKKAQVTTLTHTAMAAGQVIHFNFN